MKNKKGLSAIVAVMLLMFVTATAVVAFQSWFTTYSSGLTTDVEENNAGAKTITKVDKAVGSTLYVRNGYNNLTINSVEIEGKKCNISGSYTDSLAKIELYECAKGVKTSTPEVVIDTDQGLITKTLRNKIGTSTKAKPKFVSVWNTSLAGSSNNDQITLPLTSTGTYNFTVKWGDGNSDTITQWDQSEVTHTFSSPGKYEVEITGDIEGWRFNNGGDNEKIIEIKNWGPLKLGNQGHYFFGASNLKISATDVLNTTGMTDFSRFFSYAESTINIPNIEQWDTSQVDDMSYMFYGAYNFSDNINSWDVSNVDNMKYLFGFAKEFNFPLDNWDTSSVTDMSYMFNDAESFNQPINFDTSSVTNMRYMFKDAISLNQPVSLNTSSVTDMIYMFYGADSFNSDLNFNTSQVTQMDNMFYGANSFNSDLNFTNVSSVTSMFMMFFGANSFNQSLSDWQVHNVTNMDNMFTDANKFSQNISMWCVEQIGSKPDQFDSNSGFDGQTSLQPNWGATC